MRATLDRRARFALPLAALAAALLGASCAAARDFVVESAGAGNFADLDAWEAGIRGARVDPAAADLAAIAKGLDALAAKPSLSAAYRARLEALRGEAALLRGDRPACERALAAIRAASSSEPGAWLLESWLAPDAAAKAKALEAGIAALASGAGRLRCELGLLRYAGGKYREAAALLDEGLAELGGAWTPLYGPARDAAYALRDEAPPKGTASPEAPLTARALVAALAADTGYLSFAGTGKAPAELLSKLEELGFFIGGKAPAGPLARKDLAWFLLRLFSAIEGDPSLLARYKDRYAAKAAAGKPAKSPVPDVPADAPWFDAVLTAVEREFMDLPDGANFLPEGAVTGLDLVAVEKKLKARYR